MTLIRFVVAGLCAAAVCAQQDNPMPDDRAKGGATITESSLREYLGRLASKEFGGRGTGSDGYQKAAHYMRDHFKALGLAPAASEDSYLQRVPWTRVGPNPEKSWLRITRGEETLFEVRPGAGLNGYASVSESKQGPLALVVTDEPDGEDLADLDLAGKTVIVFARKGLTSSDRFAARQRLNNMGHMRRNVTRAGGSILAVIDDPAFEATPLESRSTPGRAAAGPAGAARGRRPSSLLIAKASLNELLGRAKAVVNLEESRSGTVLSTPELEAELVISIESTPAPAFNVLGWLEGSDPALKDEYVAVGCHLDHLGTRGGTIYYGADDDGSGSAGLMAIAKAFAKNGQPPKRSVLFLAFCGEENGLIGSRYFADNPTRSLDKMVAELQIDMIGRNEEGRGETAEQNKNCLHLVGSKKLSRDLHEACLRINDARSGFDFEWDEENVFYRSDHWNFARVGVPIAFFFTGFHPDYHKATDTPDKIDYAKLARISRYVFDLAFELSDQPVRPHIDSDLWQSLRRKGRAEPVAPLKK